MKIFIAPMNGFEQRVAYSITKKKVPVVLVTERAQADFVLSGIAHVHKRNFFTGFALTTNGYGSVWVEDAHTGNQVFAYKFTRVDTNTTVDQDYQNWADECAGHLKKTLVKMEKKSKAADHRPAIFLDQSWGRIWVARVFSAAWLSCSLALGLFTVRSRRWFLVRT